MLSINDGQCGLCAHFGEHASQPEQQRIVQLRVAGQAPEDLVEPCGHPQHEGLGLRVTAVSACSGFVAAKAG